METQLIDLLQTELLPVPYSEFLPAGDDKPAMFVRQDRGRCNYVLALGQWSADLPPLAQLGQIRRQIDSWFDASFFRGVGLIILWHGPWKSWSLAREITKPDRHGLRSTIVQGVIFLDLDSGISKIKQSAWGPMKFGNRKKTFDHIRTALEKYRHLQSEE